jgi:hypothetical protein
MNDGVALLLERMKTNPEEFTEGKWNALIQSHKMYLNPEDCKALDDGINTLMQQRFTEQVMEELVDPKKSSLEDVINQYRVKGMPSVGTTPALSSLALETSEHIKAHIATLEKIKKEYEPKQHRTLFGKLFNYQ